MKITSLTPGGDYEIVVSVGATRHKRRGTYLGPASHGYVEFRAHLYPGEAITGHMPGDTTKLRPADVKRPWSEAAAEQAEREARQQAANAAADKRHREWKASLPRNLVDLYEQSMDPGLNGKYGRVKIVPQVDFRNYRDQTAFAVEILADEAADFAAVVVEFIRRLNASGHTAMAAAVTAAFPTPNTIVAALVTIAAGDTPAPTGWRESMTIYGVRSGMADPEQFAPILAEALAAASVTPVE